MQSKIPHVVNPSLPRLVSAPTPPADPPAKLPSTCYRSRLSFSLGRSASLPPPNNRVQFSSLVKSSIPPPAPRRVDSFQELKEEKIPQSSDFVPTHMALRKDSAISPDRPALLVRGKYSLCVSAYAISKRNVLKCYDSQRVLPHLVSANLATLGADTQRLCGEDAFHVTSGRGALTLGVADGVGGWQDQGVDAGLMSHRLMQLVGEESASLTNVNTLPLDVLNRAYERVKADRSVQAGSTTACIISFCLEGNGGGGGSFMPPSPQSEGGAPPPRSISLPLPAPSLAAVNVGDSGFMIFRPTTADPSSMASGKIIFMSEPLQHHGGAPFQLAVIPSHMRHLDAVENEPKDGQQIHVPLSAGDIIILGTDGLLDNLAPSHIESIVNQELSHHQGDPQSVTAICRTLVQRAIAGPKPDDISVIVARLGLSEHVQVMPGVPSSPSPSIVSMNSSSPSISMISTIADELSEVSIPPTVTELPCVSALPMSATSFAPQDACLVEVAKIFGQPDFEGEKLVPLSISTKGVSSL